MTWPGTASPGGTGTRENQVQKRPGMQYIPLKMHLGLVPGQEKTRIGKEDLLVPGPEKTESNDLGGKVPGRFPKRENRDLFEWSGRTGPDPEGKTRKHSFCEMVWGGVGWGGVGG